MLTKSNEGETCMFLETILIICLKQLQGQRTNSSVYHLLTGKKSIQSIQDAYIYQLQNFYGIYKKMKKEEMEDKLNNLRRNGLLEILQKNGTICTVTEQGEIWLHSHQHKYPVHYFRGIEYNGITDSFYQRLILLIQTLTNTSKKHFSFIPVIDQPAIEYWVKNIYRKLKGKEKQTLHTLYNELSGVLHQFPVKEANIFVDRLTGFKQYGLSMNQLAEQYNIPLSDIYLLLIGVVHGILQEVTEKPGNYKLLSFIISDLNRQVTLTKSAEMTYQFWKNGLSITEMAKRRKLKESTIQDHLVEIAFYENNFPLERYVEKEKIDQINEAIRKVNNFKLKNIKQAVDEHISYFQIRLVLAVQNKLIAR